MNRRKKKLPKFVQHELTGLNLVALNLNLIPNRSKDEEFQRIWSKMEDIIETMTAQPPSKENEQKRKRSWFAVYESPHERYPFPRLAIDKFNSLAKENPVSLEIMIKKSKKGLSIYNGGPTVEIFAGHNPTSSMQSALWFLWRFYFQNKGWDRLKRCPQCRKWFVDQTKNKKKDRCSKHCTWQWWSRDRRKKEGHGIDQRAASKRKRAKVKIGRKED